MLVRATLVAVLLQTWVSVYSFGGASGEIRLWTSQNTTTLKARYVGKRGDLVVLKMADGTQLSINSNDLIESDQQFVAGIIDAERKSIEEKRLALFKDRSSNKNPKPEYLSDKEWEVLKENNLAREHPEMYVEFLENYRKQFVGDNVFKTKYGRIASVEGLAAVDEAIQFLKCQKKLPPLKPSRGLSKAARDHAVDSGPTGIIGHTGSRGSTPQSRIEKHGKWDGLIGENIQYGDVDARDIIMQLIVDDGVPGRGHRHTIYNEGFKTAGVAIAPHKTYIASCVIDYSGKFRDKTRR